MATPALEQSGGINNSLVHRHTLAGTNAHLSNLTVRFNQSVNKLRYTAVDIDYQNGSWQDRIVTTGTVNGVAGTNPTAMVPVTPARYTVAILTATATTSANCAAGDNRCNVRVDFNTNLVTFTTMEFRTGPNHSGAGQGAGWNTFEWCAPRPTLTKAFSATTVGVSQASTLTFTIANPAGAPARSGLTFTDSLPAGLAIASPNGVVNGCGGTPTRDAIVRVLSTREEPSSPTGITPPQVAATRRSLRILLAEDGLVNQRVARELLETRGHAVAVANNGREAVEAVAREAFVLVLMDVQMPEMDGLEATRQIRISQSVLNPAITIIPMTANAMRGDEEKCFAAGSDEYLTKPIDRVQIVRTLSKYLAAAARPSAAH